MKALLNFLLGILIFCLIVLSTPLVSAVWIWFDQSWYVILYLLLTSVFWGLFLYVLSAAGAMDDKYYGMYE